jgi:hypothetical protein
METGLSAIKTNISGYIGHVDSHRITLVGTDDCLAKAQKSGLLIHRYKATCRDNPKFITTHQRGKEKKRTHKPIRSTVAAYTGVAVGKKPFTAEAIAAKKEPKITHVYIDKTSREWIRVCLVQLNFATRLLAPPREFALTLAERYQEITQRKVFAALEIARKEGVNIVCFPELSVLLQWVEPVRREFGNMVIVLGTYYDRRFNISPVIVDGKTYLVRKINPSPGIEEVTGPRRGMRRGYEIPIFQTRFGRFVVLICLDYMKESYRIVHNSDTNIRNVDFVINPCCNKDVTNFQQQANLDCQKGNYPYILQVNPVAVEGQKCGGTCVIGTEHNKGLIRYENEGYRPKKDPVRYKLVEAKGEMMLMFVLNLSRRGVQVPLREVKMREVIPSVYQDESWQTIERINA